MKIKVCGMRNAENIVAIAALPIDYMGFIFYEKSQRYVTFLNDLNVGRVLNPANVKKVGENPANVVTDVKKVGVFVNEKIDVILSKIIDYQLDAVQLHGNETNDFIKDLRRGVPLRSPDIEKSEMLKKIIIKAIPILEKSDFEKINDYPDADFLLLDTKTPQHGGSGQKFDWSLLENITFPKPFFLSGGINEDDAEAIKQLRINNLYGIDINSKFEIEPALKDVEKVERFVNTLRND